MLSWESVVLCGKDREAWAAVAVAVLEEECEGKEEEDGAEEEEEFGREGIEVEVVLKNHHGFLGEMSYKKSLGRLAFWDALW